jgi:hypothetical protein
MAKDLQENKNVIVLPETLIIFPVAWTAFFYFQMKRGGWNVFRP